MNQTLQDAIGDGGIADLLVPARHRQLGSKDGGAGLVATANGSTPKSAKARKRELKEGKRILFPVRLVPFEVLRDWECFDADTGKDSAREIRDYFIPDFATGRTATLTKSPYNGWVADLKAEASK